MFAHQIKAYLQKANPKATLLDGHDAAMLGLTRTGDSFRGVYDAWDMLQQAMPSSMVPMPPMALLSQADESVIKVVVNSVFSRHDLTNPNGPVLIMPLRTFFNLSDWEAFFDVARSMRVLLQEDWVQRLPMSKRHRLLNILTALQQAIDRGGDHKETST